MCCVPPSGSCGVTNLEQKPLKVAVPRMRTVFRPFLDSAEATAVSRSCTDLLVLWLMASTMPAPLPSS